MNSMHVRPLSAILVSALVAGAAGAQGAQWFVDPALAANCTSAYNPATRACSGGSAAAYRTASEALGAAQPGDQVLLRGGSYSERLVPPRSGTAAAPITVSAYAGEQPVFSGTADAALSITGRSYLVFDGLQFDNVGGWARLEDSTYITVRNGRFTRATVSGTTGGFKIVRGGYHRLTGNVISDGNDNIVIQESDRNLVENNTVSTGRHSLVSLRCGNYNVVRGNTFTNAVQKAVEVYDCEGTSDAPVKLDATKHNLFESNRFTLTLASTADYRYNGMQYSGQNGIVRRNVYYNNHGGAINFQVYSDEALYNYGHRVYQNTFFNNECYALAASSSSSARYRDNRAIGNLLYRNVGCAGQAAQTSIGNTQAVVLESNSLLTSAPPFQNEAAFDLRLAAGSALIDTGPFLTKAVGAGSGMIVTVADTAYFYDGFGIPGEQGDEIQFQGQSATARIVAVNEATKQLTLDRALSWTDGQSLSLRYSGSRPEPGAYEAGTTAVRPKPPTNVQVSSL
jgi:parallel beta-helix repeat protein